MIEISKIYNENCIETLGRMPDEFLDMTITSPPYDDLRDYNGYHFPVEEIASFCLTRRKRAAWWSGWSATGRSTATKR